jgi:hypothetical protein
MFNRLDVQPDGLVLDTPGTPRLDIGLVKAEWVLVWECGASGRPPPTSIQLLVLRHHREGHLGPLSGILSQRGVAHYLSEGASAVAYREIQSHVVSRERGEISLRFFGVLISDGRGPIITHYPDGMPSDR